MFDRFLLEQLVLDRYVRYVLIVYPVVIWALSGNMVKNYEATSPNGNGIFIGKSLKTGKKSFFFHNTKGRVFLLLAGLLAVASVLFIVRIGLVLWRHFKRPLYDDVSAETMEPTEIASNQKKIYQ